MDSLSSLDRARRRIAITLIDRAEGPLRRLHPSVFWRGFTTRGALASMIVGTLSTLLLIHF